MSQAEKSFASERDERQAYEVSPSHPLLLRQLLQVCFVFFSFNRFLQSEFLEHANVSFMTDDIMNYTKILMVLRPQAKHNS